MLSLVQAASSLICHKRGTNPRSVRSLHGHRPKTKPYAPSAHAREYLHRGGDSLDSAAKGQPFSSRIVSAEWWAIRGRFINCRHGGGPLRPAFISMYVCARNHAAGLQGSVGGKKSSQMDKDAHADNEPSFRVRVLGQSVKETRERDRMADADADKSCCTIHTTGRQGSERAARRAARAAGKEHKSTIAVSCNRTDQDHVERDSEPLDRSDAALCVASDEPRWTMITSNDEDGLDTHSPV